MKKGTKGPKKNVTDAQGEMSRRFLLDVTKDGAVFIRERGTGSCPYGGLPVFSTDTREEAEALQVRHCRLSRTGQSVYRLNEFSGNVDDLDGVTAMFRETLRTRASRNAAK